MPFRSRANRRPQIESEPPYRFIGRIGQHQQVVDLARTERSDRTRTIDRLEWVIGLLDAEMVE